MKENSSANMFSSFRDPTGNLFLLENRVLRIVTRQGQNDLQTFLNSELSKRLFDSGRVARTWKLDPACYDEIPESIRRLFLKTDKGLVIIEHEKIPFPNYPYEWAPQMLHAAARLTLEIAEELQNQGLGLKDATPYNILFKGSEPVFVDLLSFEKRDPLDPTWLPYAQFIRTFLLPLQASRLLGIPLDQSLITKRDGIEPEEMYRWLRPMRRLLPPCLTLVTIPTLLATRNRGGDTSIYRPKLLKNSEQAEFVLRSVFKGLRRALDRSKPIRRKSVWSEYMDTGRTYSSDEFDTKETFVKDVLNRYAPKRILDIGCNSGHFSMLAARSGAKVVAIDYDPVVVGEVWQRASAEGLDILPLVVNITRPTPAIGWNNDEHASFLNRARGSFDMVLMLAVLHHLLVTERVPLPEILRLMSKLTNGLLLLEYVDRTDPMFRTLARGRDHLHEHFTIEYFEAACRELFEIACSKENGTRRLYLLRKK